MKRLPISQEARDLHDQSLVIDLHIDPILQHLFFDYDLNQRHDVVWRPRRNRTAYRLLHLFGRLMKWHRPFFNHIDVPRMQEAGYSGAVFGIHSWPWHSEKGWGRIKRQLTYLRDLVTTNEDLISARKPADLTAAFTSRKLACFAGVEGLHCLGGRKAHQILLDRITHLRNEYGVSYLTLTHFSKNEAATPAMGWRSNERDGLSGFGEEVVELMNGLGMLVDVAHLNNVGVLDVCRSSQAPVIATHTGVNGVRPHPRNLSDEALKCIADSGGLVGIMFAPNFLCQKGTAGSTEAVFRHIDYVVNNYGEDHVAIGSDFDGWIPRIPEDMRDAADLPRLTQAMLDHGYQGKRIQKILGGNFLRVWREVEGVSVL